jgi:hypothetical protein
LAEAHVLISDSFPLDLQGRDHMMDEALWHYCYSDPDFNHLMQWHLLSEDDGDNAGDFDPTDYDGDGVDDPQKKRKIEKQNKDRSVDDQKKCKTDEPNKKDGQDSKNEQIEKDQQKKPIE